MNRREFLAAFAVFSRHKYLGIGAEPEPVITIRQPYLQNVRQDRASVMWATETAGESAYVLYSADGSNYRRANAQQRTYYPDETQLLFPFTQYTAHLPRLAPNTLYSYHAVVDGEAIGAGSQFRTSGPGPFRFLVLGDSGMNTPAQGRVAARMEMEQAALTLHVGDIAYGDPPESSRGGTFAQLQRSYFDYYRDMMGRMPFFTTPGNHEYDTPNATPYFAVHSFPTETVPAPERGRYYSFDWGNVHFVSLDTNISLLRSIQGTGEMLNWLSRDLRSTRQFWKIVFFHHPPYAGGRNFGDLVERDVERHLCPVLEANGVQMAMAGHDHSYHRTFGIKAGRVVRNGEGTVYMTTGGGGAMLYPELFMLSQTGVQRAVHHFLRIDVDGTRLTLRAINDSGGLFDSLVLVPAPTLADSGGVTIDGPPNSGALIRIRGWNLAAQENFVSAMTGNVSGTSVSINGFPVPLNYASPTQIWGRLPIALSGAYVLTITTANGILETPLSV